MNLIERRIGLLLAMFCMLLTLAGGRALYLGAVKGGSLQDAASSQQVAVVKVPAPRGTITDRHGVELAVSAPAADVSANPLLIEDELGVAKKVAPLLGKTANEVLETLSDKETGFVYLERLLPAGKARQIEALAIEGIDVIPRTRRTYPQRFLATQVLGTVGTDGEGLAGLEYSMDDSLRGREGERRLIRDALGDPINLRDDRPARPGRDIRLTLDAAIQDRVEKVMAGVGAAFSPKAAIAVVMNPRNGEILALTNWPQVDANNPGRASATTRQNRAIQSAYEPGSTFKPFTVAGAMEERLVTPESPFSLGGSIQVADRTINEAHAGGGGTLTTAEILAHSSNVGSVTIGLKLGSQKFDRWIRRFGFGKTTGLDLAGEASGIVPDVKDYSGSTMGNLPIGHGLAVTPLQMASAYGAIANGGVLLPPRVIHAVDGKRVRSAGRGRRVIAPQTAAAIRKMLEGVLAPGGTASEVEIPGYRLAGKTGTANKPDPETGGYSETKFVSSFVGFAPAEKPELLVAVMVDEPQGAYFGAQVAAPAFQKIAAFALPYLRIAPG